LSKVRLNPLITHLIRYLPSLFPTPHLVAIRHPQQAGLRGRKSGNIKEERNRINGYLELEVVGLRIPKFQTTAETNSPNSGPRGGADGS